MELVNTLPWAGDHASIGGIVDRSFILEVLEKEAYYVTHDSFATDVTAQEVIDKLDWTKLRSYNNFDYETFYVKVSDHVLISFGQWDRRVTMMVATTSPDLVVPIREAVSDLCVPIKLDKPGVVPIKFWVMGPQGPQSVLRDIDVVGWNKISGNYSTDARYGVESLLKFRPPMEQGNLILWHGPPGTGKTHAIRALSAAWMPWCDVHYVTDPEEFFGRPFYMSNVLLDERSSYHYPPSLADDGFALSQSERWKLLIIEDADELINDDARRRSGQNLSRLLNLGDGIIGQGLKSLTLITTNEPIDAIHPAVGRPGRCMARIHFDALDREQAARWLKENDIDEKVNNETTLADLYELKRTHHQIDVPQPGYRSGTYV